MVLSDQEIVMADAAEVDAEVVPKRSRKGLFAGVFLALVFGAGGFYAVYSGMILGADHGPEAPAAQALDELPDIAFVPVESVIVALGQGAANRHLKFTAQVEVESAHAADVTKLLPRILDVFNSYLSAVDPLSLEGNAAMVRVRAQLLRRVQVVVGEGRVRDLLITEFVLN
jgi:flagellar protein FliL